MSLGAKIFKYTAPIVIPVSMGIGSLFGQSGNVMALSYEAALERAVDVNGEMRKSEINYEIAQKREIRTRRTARRPSFSTRVTATRDFLKPEEYVDLPITPSWSLSARIPLFNKVNSANIGLKQNDVDRKYLSIVSQKSNVQYAVTTAFNTALTYKSIIKNSDEKIKEYANILEIADSSDFSKLETEVLKEMKNKQNFEKEYQTQVIQLKKLLKMHDVTPNPTGTLEKPMVLANEELFFQNMFKNATKIMGAYYGLSIKDKEFAKDKAKAPLWPSADGWTEYGKDLKSNWQGFVIGATLSYQIWNWNASGLDKDIADLEIEKILIDFEEALLSQEYAMRELIQDYSNYLNLADENIIKLKEENYRKDLEKYAKGELSLDDLTGQLDGLYSEKNNYYLNILAANEIINLFRRKTENYVTPTPQFGAGVN